MAYSCLVQEWAYIAISDNMIKRLFTNKIVLYMSSRYLTYILAFIVNIYVAAEMGPENYGMWSFLLLVFHYFMFVDLGIPYSVQVYMVQNKENIRKSANYEKTGQVMVLGLSFSSIIVALYYYFGGIDKAHELNVGWLFYGMCFCGFLNFFNLFYDRVYRVKNRLLELAFKQTSVVFFMTLVTIFFRGKGLVTGMVLSYMIWCVSSFLLYMFRGGANYSGQYSNVYARDILKKGVFLFFFNAGFSFILISTRTIIGMNYSIEDFGLFSFAYFLGHSVYNCLLAFSSLVTAKLIHRFHSSDKNVVLSTLSIVRVNYVTLFHGVLYMAIIFFPVMLYFMPKYSDSLLSMILCTLMMLLFTNSFGYASYLIAINKEKKLAFLALTSFCLNILLAEILIIVVKVSYEYVVISTMIAYLYYAYMCTYYGRKSLQLPTSFMAVLFDSFPIGLLLPFLLAVIIAITGYCLLNVIPFIIFLLMNKRVIASIFQTTRKLLINPNVIDI